MAAPEQVVKQGQESERLLQEATGDTTSAPDDAGAMRAEIDRLKAENDRSQQAYKVLQGKYNAEVNADVNTLREEVERLKADAAARERELTEARHAQQRDEIKTASQKLVDAAKSLKDEGHSEQFIGLLTDLIERLRAAEERTIDRPPTESQTLGQALTQIVPEWQTLNNDPQFLAWLDQVDPLLGGVRRDRFNQHIQAGDAPRAAAFFRAYLHQGQPHQGADPPPPPPPDPETTPGNPDSGKPIYLVSQVKRLYQDMALNKYPPEEKERLDRELMAAQSEGRIREG